MGNDDSNWYFANFHEFGENAGSTPSTVTYAAGLLTVHNARLEAYISLEGQSTCIFTLFLYLRLFDETEISARYDMVIRCPYM